MSRLIKRKETGIWTIICLLRDDRSRFLLFINGPGQIPTFFQEICEPWLTLERKKWEFCGPLAGNLRSRSQNFPVFSFMVSSFGLIIRNEMKTKELMRPRRRKEALGIDRRVGRAKRRMKGTIDRALISFHCCSVNWSFSFVSSSGQHFFQKWKKNNFVKWIDQSSSFSFIIFPITNNPWKDSIDDWYHLKDGISGVIDYRKYNVKKEEETNIISW